MAAGRVGRRARALRRRVVAAVIAFVVVAATYLVWLRDSSLVAVDEVEVEGVTANQAPITRALEQAAREMTTLHVREDELREAVAGFPTVASVSADASLLHRLEITVSERLPVAKIKLGGEPVAVSADGHVLAGLEFEKQKLPALDVRMAEGELLDEEGRAQAAIAGGAPEDVRERIDGVTWDAERGGVIVELPGAPELRFGDGGRAEAKWEAIAALLADRELGSPFYLDVSVPARPVASS